MSFLRRKQGLEVLESKIIDTVHFLMADFSEVLKRLREKRFPSKRKLKERKKVRDARKK